MSQWQGPPSGPDPQDPYGHNPYGPPPQGPYGPEQPGQGQYGPGPMGPGPAGPGPAGPGPHGPQGPYGANPYGAPQQQYPPPPRNSNAGIFWVIGIVAVVAVIGVVVTAAVLLSSGDDKADPAARSFPLPTVTHLSPPPTYSPDPYTPAPTAPAGPSDLSGVLTPTVKAALRGNTYTRLSTRNGSCTSYANAALRKVLRSHPCTAPVTAALYTNPGKSVRVSIYIMQFDSSTDARAISTATNSQASPPLISPPRSGVGYWTLSRTQSNRVVYAVACRTDGGAVGSSTGVVNSAARELGVEIANVLLFKS